MLIDAHAKAMCQVEILKKQNASLRNNLICFMNRLAFLMRQSSSIGWVHGMSKEVWSVTIAERGGMASQDVPTVANDFRGCNLDFDAAIARERTAGSPS